MPVTSRTFSPELMKALKEGPLSPILQSVIADDTLMLAPRGAYLNVYYRGGSILRIEGERTFSGSIAREYFKSEDLSSQFDFRTEADAASWVEQMPQYKARMDRAFAKAAKAEREFQQLVVWENNRSPISNETEYFITDIELADSKLGARFDMLGVRWEANDRKNGRKIAPVLFEMKYAEKALANTSGMVEHLKHLSKYLETNIEMLKETVSKQFNELRSLGLINCNQENPQRVTQRPEVVFLIANTNPRSSKLRTVLHDLRNAAVASDHFDLRFFVAAFAGYGMHCASMLTLDEFEAHLESVTSRARR